METGDLEEVKAVFAALFDTCVQYLRSDVIIKHDSWFKDHLDEIREARSEGDSEHEALFRWMQDNDEDMSIVHFMKTLKDLTVYSGRVNSLVRYGKHGQAHWVKYFVSLLDGSLVKELSISDVHTALDSMLDNKVITKQVHKQAREGSDPHTCCQVMFEGLLKTRANSNWPFVFLEAISKIKPDLVQPKPDSPEQCNQADPRHAHTRDKTGGVMANSSVDGDALLHVIDELSDFSSSFCNERPGCEESIRLSEPESKSVSVQSWINSGNVDPAFIALFEDWRLQDIEPTHEEAKPEESSTFELREYQKELAEAALKGINTIICAPTGCGKTLVAVHIILTHLQDQSNVTLSRKVMFFARTIPLVMQQYQVLQKFLTPKFKIVGLTASIGVDNAKNDDQAKENVLQICSNLDVKYISCVENHIEELKEKVHLCKEELLTIHVREEDPAVMKIIEKMKTLETCMIKFADKLNEKDLKDLLKNIPLNRKGVQYGTWVIKVKNIARCLPRSELGQMNNCKRLLIILGDYLTTYNVALELHDLVLLRHVMEYLQRCFNQYQNNKDCTQDEKDYFESFSELQEMMKDRLDSENPNLTLLKSCLLKYIVDKGEASRGIIFVRTRALVKAVTLWLHSCGDLSIESLMAAPFTGTSASVASGGMTVAQQREIIKQFRAGRVRLLVATSVAEEGIDIQACNLVIKYNYTGNEITTVQTRGRSRQKDGVSVVLAMSKIIEKEKVNQKRAEMMERAVKQIRTMDPLEIQKKVEYHQQKILQEEEANEMLKQKMNKSKQRQHFKLVCHGCGVLVIDSSDIRIIRQTHHIVVNWDIMKQTKTIAETDSRVFDDIRLVGPVKCMRRIEGGRYCSCKVGSLMIFSNTPFVVLGITRFGFEVEGHGKLFNFKNWKACPFVFDEFVEEDMARYLQQVTASETQHGDNRSQVFPRENQDVVQNKKPVSNALQLKKRQGRRDECTMQDVENPAKRGCKAQILEPYINNDQWHARSFQASSMIEGGRDALPSSSPGALCELGTSMAETVFIGWSTLESNFSSTGQPISHETLPPPEFSEESSRADSMSTLHSDSLQETITETGGDNMNISGVSSSLVKANTEDVDVMASSSETAQAEQTDNNTPSSVDAGSEVEHLAEVADTVFPYR